MKEVDYHVKVTYHGYVLLDTDNVFDYDEHNTLSVSQCIEEYMQTRGLSDMLNIYSSTTTELVVKDINFSNNSIECENPYLRDLYEKIEQEAIKDFYAKILTYGDIEITINEYDDNFSMPSRYDIERIDSILAGEGTWFGANLLRLIAKADSDNIELLYKVYPNHVKIVNRHLAR